MANVIEQIVSPARYGGQIIEMTVRQNERGPQGEQGEPGEAATVNAGQAYTIEYGKQPQVMNTGTAENAVLDFYIPEGQPGAIHYYAGPGINITEDNRIEATGEMAVYWGDLVGSMSNQTDLMNALNAKQNNLTAGSNIQLNGSTISATDTTYTAGTNVSISDQNVISATDTTYSNFLGSTGADAGSAGLVPAPAAADNASILKGNGTWGQVTTAGIANSAVTVAKMDKTGLLDLFYPVGSYYETSNTSFDPNVSWGGTWEEDTAGRVTVAYDNTQTEFDTVGETGGAKNHRHDFMIGVKRFYGALVGDAFDSNSGAYCASTGNFSKESGQTHSSTTDRNNAMQNGMNSYTESTIYSKGDTWESSSLQPYIVVKRWHRTA
jgi:hypothetical protein